MHCDKHVCKMIIEYAQIMSTAHRVLMVKSTTVRLRMVDVSNDGNEF